MRIHRSIVFLNELLDVLIRLLVLVHIAVNQFILMSFFVISSIEHYYPYSDSYLSLPQILSTLIFYSNVTTFIRSIGDQSKSNQNKIKNQLIGRGRSKK
jgi:hypothetical protein